MSDKKPKKELLDKKYLMFENDNNNCWLDATLSLIVHNSTIKRIVDSSPESQIKKIIAEYEEAMDICNNNNLDLENREEKAKMILLKIQRLTSTFLKDFIKYKPGEPESAFCALLNMICHDKSNLKEQLNLNCFWCKKCSKCGLDSNSSISIKPIITLPKVNVFNPRYPTSIYTCTCKSEVEMKLIYKDLPPCLIFHFENGVTATTRFPQEFGFKSRYYYMTTLVILEKGTESDLNHYVTWVRHPFFNVWMECNDLNTGYSSFSPVKPEFDLKDVYITVFEAFDDMGRIQNDVDEDQLKKLEQADVELINLSDDDEGSNTADLEIGKSDGNAPHLEVNNLSRKELVEKEKEKTIPLQNFKTDSVEKCEENEKSFTTSDSEEDAPVCDVNLTRKMSLNGQETEAASDSLNLQDKTVDDVEEPVGETNYQHEMTEEENDCENMTVNSSHSPNKNFPEPENDPDDLKSKSADASSTDRKVEIDSNINVMTDDVTLKGSMTKDVKSTSNERKKVASSIPSEDIPSCSKRLKTSEAVPPRSKKPTDEGETLTDDVTLKGSMTKDIKSTSNKRKKVASSIPSEDIPSCSKRLKTSEAVSPRSKKPTDEGETLTDDVTLKGSMTKDIKSTSNKRKKVASSIPSEDIPSCSKRSKTSEAVSPRSKKPTNEGETSQSTSPRTGSVHTIDVLSNITRENLKLAIKAISPVTLEMFLKFGPELASKL